MKEFLENAWVVGIGGGIVSGIIVFFITKWIVDKKDNGEYLKTIELANKKVIGMLKPYIADKGLPDIEILNSIISAVSRKYKIKVSEMNSISIICEELIYEIVSNVYVANDKKEEYMNKMQKYKDDLNSTENISIDEDSYVKIRAESEYRRKLNKQYSLLISVTATLLVSVLMVFLMTEKNTIEFRVHRLANENFIILYTLIMVSCLLPLSFATFLRTKLKNRDNSTITKK